MKFLDQAKIYVKAGNGGAGAVSFRREKFIPRGGPDGGNGGRGGDVRVLCVSELNTLIDYRYQQHFKAKVGVHGMGKNRNGKNGDGITLKVPPGTQIYNEDRTVLLADMTTPGEEIVLMQGGRGGVGNAAFKSSTNQAPRQSTPGELGQDGWVWLQLKLISDAGLLGLPNAGKSTFLSRVTRAKPKIADYPFTTLTPQLGVVSSDDREFVLADIPGLIEGAHEGVGLGLQFLRHVERSGVLLHLIDGTAENVAEHYHTIRNELASYSETLAEKPEIVALNKCDALEKDEVKAKRAELQEAGVHNCHVISAVTGEGIEALLRQMLRVIDRHRAKLRESAAPEEAEKEISESP